MRLHFTFIIFILPILFFILPNSGHCELEAMSDAELSAVYAGSFGTNHPITGFSNFIIQDYDDDGSKNTALAIFNIYTTTYMEIDSLKLGYHDEYDYKNPTATYGWDQNWENIQIGGDYEDPSQDFQGSAYYLRAEFDDISNSSGRSLESIAFGANDVSGDISANFIRYSGMIDNSDDNTPEYNGHGLNLGNATISAGDLNDDDDASEFEMSLSLDGPEKGYWVKFSEATVTPNP